MFLYVSLFWGGGRGDAERETLPARHREGQSRETGAKRRRESQQTAMLSLVLCVFFMIYIVVFP
jgi:hypothetical protein